MQRIAWGVLSTAKIGLQRVLPGMLKGERGSIDAICSRDLGRAQAAAAALGIPRAYGSYEELLADPAIDAIYNPLPNHMHVEWTIKALEAGKHVLCEKPIGMTAAEAEALIAARERTGKQMLEAFMVRHHPQWHRTRDLVRAGRIGEVRAVQIAFSYFNPDPANIRNRLEVGGGALYDIGCYAVVAGRFVFDAEPRRAVSLIDRDPVMRTDRLSSALVDFAGGRQLVFTCSTQLMRYQKVHVFGTEGRIEIDIPFNAPQGEATRIRVEMLAGGELEVIELPPCDQYTLQGDAAARVFLGEVPPPWPIEDGIRNMRVLDALYRSGETGAWETV